MKTDECWLARVTQESTRSLSFRAHFGIHAEKPSLLDFNTVPDIYHFARYVPVCN